MNPGSYLNNPREAELAEKVWVIALQQPYGTFNDEMHKTFSKLPWINQNILKARDWITYNRENNRVNQQLGNKNYTAIEIGNVEHFYVAAFIYSIGGPTNPLWALVTVDGCVIWELIVGPARNVWDSLNRDMSMGDLWSRLVRNLDHNSKQFIEIDTAGIKFGIANCINSLFLKEIIQQSQTPPPATIVSPQIKTHTVASGDWLSKLTLRYYQDALLWPLLYDANKGVIGSNPNAITIGMKLVIPDISSLKKDALEKYRIRGKNWR